MDSSELNKIVGSVIGALLLFLLLGFVSSKIYGTSELAHSGDEVLAFALEIEEPAGTGGEAPEVVTIASAILTADADRGERLFAQCRACHQLEQGANGVGPYLWSVVGREIAAADGFSYSAALADKDGVWDLAALDGFLENPGAWAPGTTMGYAGLRNVEDRAHLIAYLNESDGTPMELAAAPADPAPAAEETPAPEVTVEEEAAAETATESATEEETAAETATEEQDAQAEGATEEQGAQAEGTTEEQTTEAETPAQTTEAEAETAVAAAEETPAVSEEQPATEPEATTETEAETETQVATASGIDFSTGDADAGQRVFRQCMACHQMQEGRNGVGPSLYGIIGSDIASVDGFRYSNVFQEKEGVWTGSLLYEFLEAPMDWAPGTRMAYPGLRNSQQRIDVITYINEADGSPEPLN